MPGTGELYVTSRDMPVLSSREVAMDRKAITLPLPFIVDPRGIHPVTDYGSPKLGRLIPDPQSLALWIRGMELEGWPSRPAL